MKVIIKRLWKWLYNEGGNEGNSDYTVKVDVIIWWKRKRKWLYNESFGERKRGYTTKVKKEVIYNESDRDCTLKVKVQVIT